MYGCTKKNSSNFHSSSILSSQEESLCLRKRSFQATMLQIPSGCNVIISATTNQNVLGLTSGQISMTKTANLLMPRKVRVKRQHRRESGRFSTMYVTLPWFHAHVFGTIHNMHDWSEEVQLGMFSDRVRVDSIQFYDLVCRVRRTYRCRKISVQYLIAYFCTLDLWRNWRQFVITCVLHFSSPPTVMFFSHWT